MRSSGASSGGWRSLTIAALGSIAALPLLPLLAALVPALSGLERLFNAWFELHCEQDPARTLSLAGVPLAVCARCSGIYCGLGLGALFTRPWLSPQALRGWVLAAALLLMADVALEQYGLHGPSAWLRVCTGLLLGYPAGVGLGQAVRRAPASS